jgi:hypothetical protein
LTASRLVFGVVTLPQRLAGFQRCPDPVMQHRGDPPGWGHRVVLKRTRTDDVSEQGIHVAALLIGLEDELGDLCAPSVVRVLPPALIAEQFT